MPNIRSISYEDKNLKIISASNSTVIIPINTIIEKLSELGNKADVISWIKGTIVSTLGEDQVSPELIDLDIDNDGTIITLTVSV